MKTIHVKSLVISAAMLSLSNVGFATEADIQTMDQSSVTIEKVEKIEQTANTETVEKIQKIEKIEKIEQDILAQTQAADQKVGVGQKFKDASITASVKTKLIGSDIKARDINVATQNNVVTLKGSVANEAQKTEAESIATATKNVVEVVSELTIVQKTATK